MHLLFHHASRTICRILLSDCLLPALRVNGQIGSAVINNEERTVTVDLLDSVDLKKVIVTRFDYSEEANTDLKVNTTIDLSSPKEVVLSLYQDYRWKIIANQTVERVFSVKNQVGGAVIDEKLDKLSFMSIKYDAQQNNCERFEAGADQFYRFA